jgi:ATP synthase protein I
METPPDGKEGGPGYSSYIQALRSAGPLLGSGIQLAASVVIMFFFGRWLDARLGSAPWLMLLGILFGVGAGMYSFVRTVSRLEKKKPDKGPPPP